MLTLSGSGRWIRVWVVADCTVLTSAGVLWCNPAAGVLGISITWLLVFSSSKQLWMARTEPKLHIRNCFECIPGKPMACCLKTASMACKLQPNPNCQGNTSCKWQDVLLPFGLWPHSSPPCSLVPLPSQEATHCDFSLSTVGSYSSSEGWTPASEVSGHLTHDNFILLLYRYWKDFGKV